MKHSALLLLLFMAGCKSQHIPVHQQPSTLVVDGKMWSSLFQQRSAEYDALCLQAFQLAKLRVDEGLKHTPAKPFAIITDIDETILDNSPYSVRQALKGKDYDPASWQEWTSRGTADTLTGAIPFFRYAAANGVEIFYITNREEKERAGTLKNLKRFNFPFADNEHLIMRVTESSKETRRLKVSTTHDVMLLIGDNLSDFSSVFDKKTIAERATQLDLQAAEFGKKFIILPNANYGGWEEAIYLNSRNWTEQQKDSLVRKALISW